MHLRDWKTVAAAALLAWAGAQAQPVYKWVDAEGRTHYGGQPPASLQDAEPMKLHGGGAPGRAAGPRYNADGTKQIPKEVQEFGEGLQKSLGTVDSQAVPLNCAGAVANIHGQADTMLEVGQKNVRDGYMAQADFDKAAPRIREAKGRYSVADCQSASGGKRAFYQCMSSSRNHVTGCDKQFKH